MGQSWYKVQAKKDAPSEVHIFDEIGAWGVDARSFRESIAGLGDLNVTIHSPGGDVNDGLAIFNTLQRHPGKVRVEVNTMAASMASIIALAGDETVITENGFFMVHNPWTVAMGDADGFEHTANEMRKIEDVLVSSYVRETGQSEADIRAMMRAETWLNADEAVEKGFASEILPATRAVATINDFKSDLPNKFSHWPSALKQRPASNIQTEESMDNDKLLELQAKAKDAEAAVTAKDKELESVKAQLKAETERNDKVVKETREEAGKIVALGKQHNQLDLAVKAIAEGKTEDDFKGMILDAYLQDNDNDAPDGGDGTQPVVDASIEPANREDFLATYRSLSGREASRYWNKHKATFLK